MPGGDIAKILGGPWSPPEYIAPHIQLMQAMIDADIDPPDEILLDGNIHRFRTGDDHRDKSGWYVAYPDGIPAGCFGDWRTDTVHKWRASIGRELTEAEEIASQERLEQAKRKRDEQRLRLNRAAAKACFAIWEATPVADTDHPYLKRKGILPHGVRQTSEGRLLCPLYSSEGEISTLQYIFPDGRKQYHPGGAAKGSFWWLGDMGDAKRIYIAEGFATAASIHQVTGSPVVIAYSAGNLEPVTGTVRGFSSQASIIIVADNDASGTGQRAAEKAAEAHQARVIMPPEIGDANDYAQQGGNLKDLLVGSSRWIAMGDEFCRTPAPIEWLVKKWVQEEAMMMVFGPSGCGKTFIVIDWMLRITAGQEAWMGHKVKTGDAVYLCGEGHHGLRGRIAAWKHYHQVETVGQIGITKGAVDLDSPEGLEQVIESIRETGLTPSIIAVDTLNRFMLGDENNARDTRVFLNACAVLKQEFGCTVLIVHHTGVSLEAQHRSRGSSAWKGALDIEIRIVPGEGNRSIKIVQTKNKDGELASPMFVDLHQVQIPGWFDEDGEQVTSAVVVEGVEPPQRRQDKKHQERIQSMAEAWKEGGCEEEGGHPYITKSGWMDSIKKRNPEIKESSLKQRFKASDDRYMVGKLIQEKIIEKHRAGYLVIDNQTAAALMLSVEQEEWD